MRTALAIGLDWDPDREREALLGLGVELRSAPRRGWRPEPGVVAVISEGAQLDAAAIDRLEDARVIAECGTGTDNIDVAAARRRGIVVTNVRDYCTQEVAEHTIALALCCLRSLPQLGQRVRGGHWDMAGSPRPRRLSKLTWGIVGYGKIGHAVAVRARPLVREVVCFDPLVASAEAALPLGSLEQLLAASDVISLHASGEASAIVTEATLRAARPGSVLVNVARGHLVDGAALLHALDDGRLAAAALDVTDPEPPDPDDRLLRHPRVVVTPHAAWWSTEAEGELRRRVIENVTAVLRGLPAPDALADDRSPAARRPTR